MPFHIKEWLEGKHYYVIFYIFINNACRVILSALHFNENSRKVHATTKTNEKRYSINFPKQKKGEYTVREIKASSTYSKYHLQNFKL